MNIEGHGPRKVSQATWILVGLVAGAVLGVACNRWLGPKHPDLIWFADRVARPIGQIFMRLLFMVVVPLVFSSLVLGVAGLGGVKNLGRVGGKTIFYFLASTALAASIGILLVSVVRPGDSLPKGKAEQIRDAFKDDATAKIARTSDNERFVLDLMGKVFPEKDAEARALYESAKAAEESKKSFVVDTLINMVPQNVIRAPADGDMLGLIFFAIIVGISTTMVAKEKMTTFLGFLEGFYEVCLVIIGMTMKLAPYGVAGLIFFVTAKLGIDMLKSLGWFVVTAIAGLLFHQFVVLGAMAWLLGGIPPFEFFRRARALIVTAFSTSSSNATLPTTIRTAQEEFGVAPHIAGFVLPLGATMNMNGTALFEGVVVLFLAQVWGVDLSVGQQVLIVSLTVLTAVGAAGVPGGSLPLIAAVLGQVGIPPTLIGVIIGVDRLVDMTRTIPNVCSDLVGAIWVARTEQAIRR